MRIAVLALALLAACGRAAPPPRRPALAVTPPPAIAPPPPVAVVEPQPAPPLSVRPASEPEVAILSSLCEPVWVPEDDGTKRIACDEHPPFRKTKRAPSDPIPMLAGDRMSACTVSALYRGSFTKAGAREAVLSFDSCWESPGGFDTNYTNAVSVVLAEEGADGRWRSTAVNASLDATGCKVGRRADGRNVLLCTGGFGAYSLGSVHFGFVVDYTRKPSPFGTVFWAFDDDFSCNGDPHLEHGLVALKRVGLTVADTNGDGNDDFTVELERERIAPSAKLDAKMAASCAGGGTTSAGNSAGLGPPFPVTEKAKIEIVSAGNSYAPSAASRKILATWTAQTGNDLYGLRGAAPPAIWK